MKIKGYFKTLKNIFSNKIGSFKSEEADQATDQDYEKTVSMSFKDFEEWCNKRASDGCWGMNEAMICMEVIGHIYKYKRKDREKCGISLTAIFIM